MPARMKCAICSLMALVMVTGSIAPPPQKAPPDDAERFNRTRARYLFRVTLHPQWKSKVCWRAPNSWPPTPRPVDRRAGIALVLHGPEVEIFTRKNYTKYRHIVDRAARLDAGA